MCVCGKIIRFCRIFLLTGFSFEKIKTKKPPIKFAISLILCIFAPFNDGWEGAIGFLLFFK